MGMQLLDDPLIQFYLVSVGTLVVISVVRATLLVPKTISNDLPLPIETKTTCSRETEHARD
jgi:hypothetical protein